MRLISWNIRNGGGRRRPEQVAALVTRAPAVVALQEVLQGAVASFRSAFESAGFAYVADSFSLAPDRALLVGPRRYGQLVASRWPIETLRPESFDLPWPERVLSVRIETPRGQVEVHTTHIPPGSSNGWIKIDMLEGIYRRLARPQEVPRILCGDFNTPKEEHADGRLVSWSRPHQPRWAAAEVSVVRGLAEHGLADVYRRLHGHAGTDASIVIRGRPRRYDHVFASPDLAATSCRYLHDAREAGLSDHAPVEVDFDVTRSPTTSVS